MKIERKPSLWWLVLAPLIFLLGAGGGTALLIVRIASLSKGETFLAPVERSFAIEEPGTYILWHDYRILFEGRAFNTEPSLPSGAGIRLSHRGEEIPTARSWGATVTSGQHEKSEVARYVIEEPGEYTLAITGLHEDHVFSFARSGVKGILGAAFACLLLNLLGWIGAPVVIIVVLVRRSRAGA